MKNNMKLKAVKGINMNLLISQLEEQLNADRLEDRLEALKKLKSLADEGKIELLKKEGYTNNHVHTKYSFSPYSPTKAIWMGIKNGLSTIGIMDHDSLSGAKEFIKAGKIGRIATTIGFEIRTNWSKTDLNGKRINNPDQDTSAYIAAHGVPHDRIDEAGAYLIKMRDARNIRNRQEIIKINEIMKPFDIKIDFDRDVVPISYNDKGGSITERHILYALTIAMINKVGRDKALISLLSDDMKLPLSKKQIEYLKDSECNIYEYDVLNILKGYFVKDIYIKTELDETPYVDEAVDFIKELGAISSYCYLGDVAASPTGDKKAQKFEDDYLEVVLDSCKNIGFNAIAFMPSRNSREQLIRLMKLCDKRSFMQISGEDINQPRQSFICKQLKENIYSHLTLSTWALVGHEAAMSDDSNNGLFVDTTTPLNQRMKKFKAIGEKCNNKL